MPVDGRVVADQLLNLRHPAAGRLSIATLNMPALLLFAVILGIWGADLSRGDEPSDVHEMMSRSAEPRMERRDTVSGWLLVAGALVKKPRWRFSDAARSRTSNSLKSVPGVGLGGPDMAPVLHVKTCTAIETLGQRARGQGARTVGQSTRAETKTIAVRSDARLLEAGHASHAKVGRGSGGRSTTCAATGRAGLPTTLRIWNDFDAQHRHRRYRSLK